VSCEPFVHDTLELVERGVRLPKARNQVRQATGQAVVEARVRRFEPQDHARRVIRPADCGQGSLNAGVVVRLRCLKGRLRGTGGSPAASTQNLGVVLNRRLSHD
jgi:hypothetical protein